MPVTRALARLGTVVSRRRQRARAIGGRADRLRDERRFREAAELYEAALAILPGHAGYHVQCGHMLKESGAPDAAEAHYRAAAALAPADPDVPLQLGHLFKLTGRPAEAEIAYRQALRLRPGWRDAERELAMLGVDPDEDGAPPLRPVDAEPPGLVERDATLLAAAGAAPLLPDLLPRAPAELLHGHGEGIELRRLGRIERTHWGTRRTLRGVEAIRGFCVSLEPIVAIEILLNGMTLYRGSPGGGHPLSHESERPGLRKYVFNAWVDLSRMTRGRYDLRIRALDAMRQARSLDEEVVVERAWTEAEHPRSDGVVTLDPADPRGVDEQVNARPTMVRPGRRSLFDPPPRTILVQRPDQLGDMVVSVPAIRRIRAIFPGARLIGVLSRANVDLARSLDLFDDIVVTEFGEDYFERRRVMPLDVQEELKRNLDRFAIDLAIDLSENVWSRRLLLLSGATHLYGFRAGGDMPGLFVDLEGNTHDPWDNHEVVPHTNKLVGLVEWLGAMARSETNIEPRTAPTAAALAEFGLADDARFAVLHDGARLQFSRWPHGAELAAMLLEATDLSVVWMTDDAGTRAGLPAELTGSPRFQLVDRRLPFDLFDALVARCALFVGNDSGPKHLASLRGANVVSIHSARNNWNEWGQENGGLILSRRMPCAGCLVHFDPEDCGRDFACVRDIRPQEVFDAAMRLLAPRDGDDAAPAAPLSGQAVSR